MSSQPSPNVSSPSPESSHILIRFSSIKPVPTKSPVRTKLPVNIELPVSTKSLVSSETLKTSELPVQMKSPLETELLLTTETLVSSSPTPSTSSAVPLIFQNQPPTTSSLSMGNKRKRPTTGIKEPKKVFRYTGKGSPSDSSSFKSPSSSSSGSDDDSTDDNGESKKQQAHKQKVNSLVVHLSAHKPTRPANGPVLHKSTSHKRTKQKTPAAHKQDEFEFNTNDELEYDVEKMKELYNKESIKVQTDKKGERRYISEDDVTIWFCQPDSPSKKPYLMQYLIFDGRLENIFDGRLDIAVHL